MKKLFTFIAAVLVSVAALADSYTLTFKDTGTKYDGGTDYATVAEAFGDAASAYVKSITATKVVPAQQGRGAKFGTKSQAGSLVIELTDAATTLAQDIVITASPYIAGTDADVAAQPQLKVNGVEVKLDTTNVTTFAPKQYTVSLNAYTNKIVIEGVTNDWCRFYITDITLSPSKYQYHSATKTPGARWEVLLGPDMINKEGGKTAAGDEKYTVKQAINWISYSSTNDTLSNGLKEVQNSNRWTNINPWTAQAGAFIQATGVADDTKGSVISPVFGGNNQKSMTFYVQDAYGFRAFAAGSASGSAADNNCISIKAVDIDGNEITGTSTPGGIYGKGTASDVAAIDLDPAQKYIITVTSANKDIQLTGINLLCADTLMAPDYHSPVVPTDAYWETTMTPAVGIEKTLGGAANWGVDENNYNWVVYDRTDGAQLLDDGTTPVAKNNRNAVYDPETAKKDPNYTKINNTMTISCVPQDDNGDVKQKKTVTFWVKDTKKFRAFFTGSTSLKTTDKIYAKITATSTDGDIVTATTTPGTLYGKGWIGDSLSVMLDPAKKYQIFIESDYEAATQKNKSYDIQIDGINLYTEQSYNDEQNGVGTLNKLVAAAKDGETIELNASKEYTLNGVADADLRKITINGNKANVTANATGQIAAQVSIILKDIIFNYSDTAQVAPVALSAVADSSLYSYDAVADTALYAGANQRVFMADRIEIDGCEFNNLGNTLISDGNGPKWALSNLIINNTIAQLKGSKEKECVIDWYTNGVSIRHINISNSTLYNTNEDNKLYFLRYTNASNSQPVNVWGTGATCDWTMTSNTIVNLPSNQNFANNYTSHASQATISFKKNVFANTWRIQKAMGSCIKDLTVTDNAISGKTNTVDGTDAKQYATVDTLMNVFANGELVNFSPARASYAEFKGYGDPRWLQEYPYLDGAQETIIPGTKLIAMLGGKNQGGNERTEIATAYKDYVEYINPTSTLDNGSAEVQNTNRWVYNNYMTDSVLISQQAYDEANNCVVVNDGSFTVNGAQVLNPVLSAANGKYMDFFVKNAGAFKVYASGSASSAGAIVATAYTADTTVVASTDTTMTKKTTYSRAIELQLDPTKKYRVRLTNVGGDALVYAVKLGPTYPIAGYQTPAFKLNTPSIDEVTKDSMFVTVVAPSEYTTGTMIAPETKLAVSVNNTWKYAAPGETLSLAMARPANLGNGTQAIALVSKVQQIYADGSVMAPAQTDSVTAFVIAYKSAGDEVDAIEKADAEQYTSEGWFRNSTLTYEAKQQTVILDDKSVVKLNGIVMTKDDNIKLYLDAVDSVIVYAVPTSDAVETTINATIGNEAIAQVTIPAKEYGHLLAMNLKNKTGEKELLITATDENMVYAIQFVKIVVDPSTGIQTTETTVVTADGKVYNVSGALMGNQRAGLAKGLYIQNGKKFVVK